MTHFWVAGSPVCDNVTMRYYVDNETKASIEFVASVSTGVGFSDQTAPWGTRWAGKGAASTGWFHNFRIPFDRIRITYQLVNHTVPDSHTIWLIVRGTEGKMNIRIQDLYLPSNARMKLFKIDKTLDVLEFVDLVDLPMGTRGMFFQSTLQVESSQNFNFMEGCFHYYDHDTYKTFPGMLLSTGMEDYYDSAFYFDGGNFHAPISGSTHKTQDSDGVTKWSGYRYHDMDPIVFQNGMRFQWRNGDVTDPATGLKCILEKNGTLIGNPQKSHIKAYVWVYVW